MKPIMDLRKQYGEAFEKRHGIRLGFMSFYVKAVVEALKRYPEVNASIALTAMMWSTTTISTSAWRFPRRAAW